MASPFGHLAAGLGAYLVATAPSGAAPLRTAGFASAVLFMALVPDFMGIVEASGQHQLLGSANRGDIVAVMHGLTFGLLASAAIAGALPGLRKVFWAAVLGLMAGHGSHLLLDALSRRGAPMLTPFDWTSRGLGVAILPDADIRILWRPLIDAVRVVGVEMAVLLPLVWTAWILGRDSGESRSKARIGAFALSWIGGAVAVWWSISHGGRV